MAHHQSAKKRIRQTAKLRLANRYYAKTMRNALRDLRTMTDAKQASERLPKVISMIDRLKRRNQIHPNKASNLKSKLSRFVNGLS